jgi:hypothetical protein
MYAMVSDRSAPVGSSSMLIVDVYNMSEKLDTQSNH